MAEPHEHGGTLWAAARESGRAPSDILDFSSNTDSLSEALTREVVAGLPETFAHYPDETCTQLTAALSVQEGLEPDAILVTNGSSEAIYLAAHGLGIRCALVVAPVFSEYARAFQAHGVPHELLVLDPETGFALSPADERLLVDSAADCVVLCSPGNPTGAVHDLERLAALLAPRTLLVDLTYRDFLPAAQRRVHAHAVLAAANPRVVSVMSFTKYFACPDVRLGYVAANGSAIRALKRLKPPWTVSRRAELAGLAMLERQEDYHLAKEPLLALKREFAIGLEGCGLFASVLTGAANFLLCRLAGGVDAGSLRRECVREGFLIRVCDNIPGMPPGWVRLAVRGAADNAAFLAATARVRERLPT